MQMVHDDDAMTGMNIAWIIIYMLLNSGLIYMHWNLAPIIREWIKVTNTVIHIKEVDERP